MIVIAILAIPFIFYFVQSPDYGAMGSDRFGRIYDRPITRIEFQKNARLFNLARELGMFSFIQDLVAGARNETEAYTEFTCNRLILKHEAEKLGIRAAPSEIANVVRGFRVFQGESGFDLSKYNEFTQNALPSLGFNESHIEELAADQITLNRIHDLVAGGVHVPETETRMNYQQVYGKMNVALVRFRNQDFDKDIKITDADIAAYYEKNKAKLQTEEKRKVEFVAFGLSEEEKKLTGKARIDVLQKLADRANDFTQALLEKDADFQKTATRFQTPLQHTAEFTTAAPDPLLKGNPELTQAASKLSQQEPNSDAIQMPDGFHIMHLAGVTPARPLTLEEAKPKIIDSLRAERLRQLLTTKATDVTQQIREKMKTGTTAEVAIQQAGFKVERIPPFSQLDNPFDKVELDKPEPKKEPTPPPSPDLPSIKAGVAELNPGEVSEFIPTADGGLIAILEKREPIDEAKYTLARPSLEARFLQSMQRVAFHEWLRERRLASGFQILEG
jgi:hypothetical protein